MTKPLYSLAFYKPDNVLPLNFRTTGYLRWKKGRVMLRLFPVTPVACYGVTFTFIKIEEIDRFLIKSGSFEICKLLNPFHRH
jgi:hypothetical protein